MMSTISGNAMHVLLSSRALFVRRIRALSRLILRAAISVGGAPFCYLKVGETCMCLFILGTKPIEAELNRINKNTIFVV